ncbi:hypothetical protein K469DRAFT_705386 [Zopfia rhizophila CBS 207.26]|uniref:Peptidase S33 tripeptidyl aminopeptidase-like C-terminal domain-containing protein n=1 Tax=Zopfia rhizophila CBS 207.26 TaxID=1314779 RepID=A0A6A6E8F5_9PEZI|nr:hypothetical protein K469DRAFT_705386 [Zopfia rhizophila CBS 207.26]
MPEVLIPVLHLHALHRIFTSIHLIRSSDCFVQIQASGDIQFHSCYDGLECAKLKLPLDYFNGTHPHKTISLALAKLPAKVPVDDPRYGGPILINPGGPGGSGVLLAALMGNQLQTIVDSAEDPDSIQGWRQKEMSKAKYFDIIGFDPRGIGETGPAATCMPGPAAWSWMLRELEEGILGSSDAALGRHWSMAHAFGAACNQAMEEEDEPDIKHYLTTASVARDMLELVEKHAEYTTKLARKSFAAKAVEGSRKTRLCSNSQLPYHEPNTSKLQYWGFSYGTFLGSTFASMFPERVGRLILDGVVDADEYYNNLGNNSLNDLEKVMQSFYTYCITVGPDACALAESGSTAKDVETRTQNIIESLYHSPLPVPAAAGPEIITYSDVKHLVFGGLYSPSTSFPVVAQILATIEARDGSGLAPALRSRHVYTCPVNSSISEKIYTDVPQFAVLCSDGIDQSSLNITIYDAYWKALAAESPTAGAIWARLKMKCAGWPLKAVYRFRGPFEGSTSHPILWIGNTADPVTPLGSAKAMSKKFPGSVLLTQDSGGHCSIAQPTPCTLTHIRTYFQTGDLPPPNTLCIPPDSPFNLNSTDPKSPFYDPDLVHTILGIDESEFEGKGDDSAMMEEYVQLELELRNWASRDELKEVRGSESGRKMMWAGEEVKEYFATQNFFGYGDRRGMEQRVGMLFGGLFA